MANDQYKHKILQLLPGDGWFAIYEVSEDKDLDNLKLLYTRLIAWALAEFEDKDTGETFQRIVGVTPSDYSEIDVHWKHDNRLVRYWHPDLGDADIDEEARTTKDLRVNPDDD